MNLKEVLEKAISCELQMKEFDDFNNGIDAKNSFDLMALEDIKEFLIHMPGTFFTNKIKKDECIRMYEYKLVIIDYYLFGLAISVSQKIEIRESIEEEVYRADADRNNLENLVLKKLSK